MPCPVGRKYDPSHATCRSCPVSCRTNTAPGRLPEQISVVVDGATLITNARLSSLNAWNNKPRWHYLRQRQKWAKVLAGSLTIWGPPEGKRVLTVVRYVPDRRHMIRDRDNLVAAAKPVKDVLVRQGVVFDDSDAFLEFEVIQHIDRGNPRAEVRLL